VKRRVLDAVSAPIVPEQGLVVNSLTARTAAPESPPHGGFDITME